MVGGGGVFVVCVHVCVRVWARAHARVRAFSCLRTRRLLVACRFTTLITFVAPPLIPYSPRLHGCIRTVPAPAALATHNLIRRR